METVLAIAERYLPHAGEVNGDGLNSMPGGFVGPYQEGYEAGLARARESGYRTGYKEGFADGLKSATGASAAPTASEPGNGANNGTGSHGGPRLLGLPCEKCGAFFFSGETQCPRCKAVRATRKPK